jgi:hypothetical protein
VEVAADDRVRGGGEPQSSAPAMNEAGLGVFWQSSVAFDSSKSKGSGVLSDLSCESCNPVIPYTGLTLRPIAAGLSQETCRV